MAFYPFEVSAIDASGNDYHGYENDGKIKYSEGVIGQSVLLDGNGSYIKIENNDNFQLETWTITRWFKVGAVG